MFCLKPLMWPIMLYYSRNCGSEKATISYCGNKTKVFQLETSSRRCVAGGGGGLAEAQWYDAGSQTGSRKAPWLRSASSQQPRRRNLLMRPMNATNEYPIDSAATQTTHAEQVFNQLGLSPVADSI